MFTDKISELKNIESGKKAFILANGPSVLDCNLSKIKNNDIIISMNSSTLLEVEFGFVSDYYVLSDVRFISNLHKRPYATRLLNEKTKRILRSELSEYDDFTYIDRTFYVNPLGRDGFSNDLAQGFYFGCTTTMLAVQLAYYLGVSEIYLLGVDLNYLNGSTRFYSEHKIEFADPFISVQINNLLIAKSFLFENNVGFFNCSVNSFIRPYLGYVSFDKIVDNEL